MMTMCAPTTLQCTRRHGAGAALLACGALLALAARAQDACTYVHSGYLEGLPVEMPVTYLTPGLADWRVAVPVPAQCGGAAGHEALVCDYGTRPRVRAGRGDLRVRRAPAPAGYATVQLTVYCGLPYPPPALPQPAPLHTMLNILPKLPNRFQNLSSPAEPSMAPVPEQPNDLLLPSYDAEEESEEESEEETEEQLVNEDQPSRTMHE